MIDSGSEIPNEVMTKIYVSGGMIEERVTIAMVQMPTITEPTNRVTYCFQHGI